MGKYSLVLLRPLTDRISAVVELESFGYWRLPIAEAESRPNEDALRDLTNLASGRRRAGLEVVYCDFIANKKEYINKLQYSDNNGLR